MRWIIATTVVLVGCSRAERGEAPLRPSRISSCVAAAVSAESALKASIEAEKQEKLRSTLANARSKMAVFRDAKDDKYVYIALSDAMKALAAASSAGANTVEFAPFAERSFLDASIACAKAITDDVEITDPDPPEQPKHEPPAYDGAFHLTGEVARCGTDGLLLKYEENYYFIRGASCPTLTLIQGWVEPSGGRIQVDLGRAGRMVPQMKLSDAEKAKDDRQTHQTALTLYESRFAEEMAAYQKAVAERAATVQRNARMRAANRTRANAEKAKFWPIMRALQATLKGGPLPRPATPPAPSVPPTAAPPPIPSAPAPTGGKELDLTDPGY